MNLQTTWRNTQSLAKRAYRFSKPHAINTAQRIQLLYARLPGWMGSGTLHLVLLVFIVGIPSCERNDFKRPSIIQVDLVAAPIAEKTVVKKQAPKKKAAPKPTSPISKVLSKPKPPAPKPKPAPTPAAKPKKAKAPQPATEKPRPKEAPKPKPKPVKEPPKDALDNLLEDFLEEGEEPQTGNSEISEQTISAVRAIQQQVEEQWAVPANVRFVDNPVVTLRFKLNQAGILASDVTVANQGRYKSDASFRALADSAVRAVHNAAPFKGLPAKAHKHWGDLEMTFDPQNMR